MDTNEEINSLKRQNLILLGILQLVIEDLNAGNNKLNPIRHSAILKLEEKFDFERM